MKYFWVALFLLVSCSKSDVEDINSQSSASEFEVLELIVKSSQSLAQSEVWADIKNKKHINFKTCIIDTAYQEPVVNEEFLIETEFEEIKATSNGAGCISWYETYNFDYFANEGHYRANRKIIGKGRFKGNIDIPIALDFWASQNIVSDLRSENLLTIGESIEVVSDQLSRFDLQRSHIRADKANFTVLSQKYFEDKAIIKSKFSISPYFVRKGKSHEEIELELSTGKFKAKIDLIQKNIDGSNKSLLDSYEGIVEVKNKKIEISDFELTIDQKVHDRSFIDLIVELVPIEEPLGMGVLKASMPINTLSGTNENELVLFNTNNNENSLELSYSGTHEEGRFGFLIDFLEIKGARTVRGSYKNTDSTRTTKAVFEVCLVNPLLKEIIRGEKFNVFLTNSSGDIESEKKEVSTRMKDGCLKYEAELSYDDNGKRYWKEYFINVEGVNDTYANIFREQKVYINPWLDSNDIDFGFDGRDQTPAVTKDSSEIVRPKIYIKKLDYEFSEILTERPKINKRLNLSFKKKYNFSFEPKKIVRDPYDKEKKAEDLLHGIYDIKFYVLAPKYKKQINLNEFNPSDFELLAYSSNTHEINNEIASIDADFEFNIQDHKFSAQRNYLAMIISPSDRNSNLLEGMIVIPFDMDKTAGSSFSRLKTDGVFNQERNFKYGLSKLKNQMPPKVRKITESNYEYFKRQIRNKLDGVKFAFRWPVNDDRVKPEETKLLLSHYESINDFIKLNNLKTNKEIIEKVFKDKTIQDDSLKEQVCNIFYNRAEYGKNQRGYKKTIVSTHPMYQKCLEDINSLVEFNSYSFLENITKHPQNLEFLDQFQLQVGNAYMVSKGLRRQEDFGTRTSKYSGKEAMFGAGLEATLPVIGLIVGFIPVIGPVYNRLIVPAGRQLMRQLKRKNVRSAALLGGLGGAFAFMGSAHYVTGNKEDHYQTDRTAEELNSLFREINQVSYISHGVGLGVNYEGEVKQCIVIGGKPYSIVRTFKQAGRVKKSCPNDDCSPLTLGSISNKRIVVCKEGLERMNLSENFYIVSNDYHKNGVTTGRNVNERKIEIIRSKHAFDSYIQARSDNITTKVLVETKNENHIDIGPIYSDYLKKGNLQNESSNLFSDGQFPGLVFPE